MTFQNSISSLSGSLTADKPLTSNEKRSLYNEKFKQQRKAKKKAEVFRRTEGNTRYIYNEHHVIKYTVFNAAQRDCGGDPSFTAYYHSLPAEDREQITIEIIK